MTGSPTRARAAVAALFAVNGASFATVLPRYPLLKDELGLTNAQFGLVVAAAPLGALASGVVAGLITARWGSARVAVASSALLALNLVLVALVPAAGVAVLLAAALALGGAADSVADVSENAHGLRVQRLLGRSVLNGMHGAWSIGAVGGGLIGSAAAGLDLPLLGHLGGWAVVALVVVGVSARWMLPGTDPRPPSEGSAPRALALVLPLVVLGVVGASANLVEDAGSTWGAIWLGGLGASAAGAGLGFVALQAAQIVGRLTGDRWVTRFGDRAVARVGGGLVAVGGVLAVGVPAVPTTLVGFAMAGLGVATIIPAAMRAADDVPGLPAGAGLAVAGTVLRVALLVSPPVVGLVADAASLRAGLLVVPLCGLVIVLLAGRLEGRVGSS